MTTENKFARLMRDTGPALFFMPAGLIMIVFALIMMNMKTDTFKKTTGTVTAGSKISEGYYFEQIRIIED